MTERNRLFGVILACLLAAASASAGDHSRSNSPTYVSLIDLLVRPERIEEGMVRVGGYLAAPSGLNLFLTKEHAEIEDIATSVSVQSDALPELRSSGCLNRFVMLVGDFGQRTGGTYAIRQLEEVWLPSAEWGKKLCWKRE